MKKLDKMILILIPCFSLIFVTNISQGGVVGLTWSGTVTANAQAGVVYNSNNGAFSANAFACYTDPNNEAIWSEASAYASIFFDSYGDIYAELSTDYWFGSPVPTASFLIEGTLTIDSSPEFPIGTPLVLTISSLMGTIGSNQLYRDDKCIWFRGGSGEFIDSCQVFGGETLNLISMGSTSGAQVNSIFLDVTPEPATLFLLALGGLILRRK